VLVHDQNQIYQVHSSYIDGIVDVMEGQNPVAEDGAATSYIYSFLLGTTAPGKYELLNSPQGSYIRLGSAPTLPLSVNLRGDKSDGTYRNNPVDLARYIVTTRGQFKLDDATEIDNTAFDDVAAELVLGSASSATVIVGWATYDQTNVGDLVSILLGGVGVSAWFKRDGGRFTVKRHNGAAGGTPVGTYTRADVKRMSLESLDAGSPVYSVAIAWRKNDVVHGSADIAGAVRGTANHNFAMKDWRIAQQPDADVLSAYPSASSISLESAITYWHDAIAEALRLQGIYSGMPQAFKAFFKHRALSLERLDVIGFHYEDESKLGVPQSRFYTSSTPTQYVVLNIEEVPAEGGTVVTFSRENNKLDNSGTSR
jgi:hypothetical protein